VIGIPKVGARRCEPRRVSRLLGRSVTHVTEITKSAEVNSPQLLPDRLIPRGRRGPSAHPGCEAQTLRRAQERLRHSTVTTTLDHYSHVTATMQQDAAGRLDAAFRGAMMGLAERK